jgi:tRNA(Ile)-lysidine synthetase-like protein
VRYHVGVHDLAERLLIHIRREELLHAGDRVGVAVSGGIDSVALLRLLLELRQELGIVLSVVHFNHKLRGAESDADEEFVAGLAHEHELEFYSASGDTAQFAAEEHSGIEAAARRLRYGFFGKLLGAEEESEDSGTSGAKAQDLEASHRSAGSAAPPKDPGQGLKSESAEDRYGTAEAVPFQSPTPAGEATHLRNPTTAQEAVPFLIASQPSAKDAQGILNKIATGHTLDDQAETVLMRLIRGTGLRGLGGIYPRIVVECDIEDAGGDGHGEIVRPLLAIRRCELQRYLTDLKQPWREDSTNSDSAFTRNRLRKLVMPLLEREFNPAVVESFAELAEIARDEEDYWENEVSGWLGTVVLWSQPEWSRGTAGFDESRGLVQILPLDSPWTRDAEEGQDTNATVAETPRGFRGDPSGQGVPRSARDDSPFDDSHFSVEAGPAVMNASLSRPWLLTEPRAVQRRVLKAIGEQAGIPLEFKHIEEIMRFAAEDGPAGKELSLPLGWKIRREPEAMIFLTPDLRLQERIPDYEYSLAVPGRVVVPELGVVIEAMRVTLNDPNVEDQAGDAEYNPQQLLREDLLGGPLTVRNWRAGDRFWPAHTKSPKKIKELLQERHVVQPERRLWPVVVTENEIVWMRGFPVPAKLRATPNHEAVRIREMSWAEEHAI